jgi:hypothetical protein
MHGTTKVPMLSFSFSTEPLPDRDMVQSRRHTALTALGEIETRSRVESILEDKVMKQPSRLLIRFRECKDMAGLPNIDLFEDIRDNWPSCLVDEDDVQLNALQRQFLKSCEQALL